MRTDCVRIQGLNSKILGFVGLILTQLSSLFIF